MAVANQTPASVASDYATIAFIVSQLMGSMATAALVRVQACTNAGGIVPVGTVDVVLLVDMQTEDGRTIPHGTIFKAPYMRIQGGTNAVILDPQAGDIGLCVFAMRDISAVKSDPNAARSRQPSPGAPPGSRRTFSLSDALYVGGMLNGAPVQYVQFEAGGIKVKSPAQITLEAPTIVIQGAVEQSGGNVSIAQDLAVGGAAAVTGDVTGQGTSLHTHVHGGVQPGGGDTGPPT